MLRRGELGGKIGEFFYNVFTTFCHPKGGAKMCAVTNFRVRSLGLGKTDAVALLLREKLSVF